MVSRTINEGLNLLTLDPPNKERTPKDPTIREKFNTYKFADYKDQVIDLLKRVCTVSVDTMKIIEQMPK